MSATFQINFSVKIKEEMEVTVRVGSRELFFVVFFCLFVFNMGEFTAWMKTDKNDPEEKRQMMFQEKERMVIAQMFLDRNKEMGSSTRTSCWL